MYKQRKRIPKHQKIRAELQKEVGSRCPFCVNDEVGHFEIHHIDENNSNNVFENLLLLCSTCHSKFTKKEWPISKARQQKDEYIKLPYFRLLESNPIDSFDYICYNMRLDNGRYPEGNGNGSIANIRVTDPYNLKITLKQVDGRIWKGEVNLKTKNYGELFFVYDHNIEIEVGRRECYIMQIYHEQSRVDKLIFKPLTDLNDYRNETMIRTVPLK